MAIKDTLEIINRIKEEIPMSAESRKKLAALPFAEKLRILDKLRERSMAVAAARKKLQESQKTAK